MLCYFSPTELNSPHQLSSTANNHSTNPNKIFDFCEYFCVYNANIKDGFELYHDPTARTPKIEKVSSRVCVKREDFD